MEQNLSDDVVKPKDKILEENGYTFDDVLILPMDSSILPSETDISVKLSKSIELSIPLMSSAMDTVTEAKMAIAIAQHGGIGCIHKNMSVESQVEEVRAVKKHEGWIVSDPLTIHKDSPIQDVIMLMSTYNYSGIPVVDSSGYLEGIITNRDVRFTDDKGVIVQDLMTPMESLITVRDGINKIDACKLLHKHRIEKLLVIDNKNRCIGLITVRDIEKFIDYPNSCTDEKSRLRVAAAVGIGKSGMVRAKALVEAEVDIIIVDTAHGHSELVINMVKNLRESYPDLTIIGGNIATAEAALALCKAGVDCVKVGIGPGSICTTRLVAGVGVPQLSAVLNVISVCKKYGVTVIADGGIKSSGDIAKAIGAGANIAMMGSLFAGTDESPGEKLLYDGRTYKAYRGMGSVAAMKKGSKDRYFQQKFSKLVPEGVEAMVPFKGNVADVIKQLTGGLSLAMGYTGSTNITDFQNRVQFIKITSAGLQESKVHDVVMVKETTS